MAIGTAGVRVRLDAMGERVIAMSTVLEALKVLCEFLTCVSLQVSW